MTFLLLSSHTKVIFFLWLGNTTTTTRVRHFSPKKPHGISNEADKYMLSHFAVAFIIPCDDYFNLTITNAVYYAKCDGFLMCGEKGVVITCPEFHLFVCAFITTSWVDTHHHVWTWFWINPRIYVLKTSSRIETVTYVWLHTHTLVRIVKDILLWDVFALDSPPGSSTTGLYAELCLRCIWNKPIPGIVALHRCLQIHSFPDSNKTAKISPGCFDHFLQLTLAAGGS